MNTFDVTVYHAINQFAGHMPVLDPIMKFLAQYALELYAVLFVVAWLALPKRDAGNRHSLLIAGVAGIVALLINVIIASVWNRPRPFVTLPEGSFTKLIPHVPDSSFPSDHTSGSFAFAFASLGNNKKWISTTFMTLAILVMVSRVYCGVHYPTDVLASVVVGFVAGKIAWMLSPLLRPVTAFACRLFGYGPQSAGSGK